MMASGRIVEAVAGNPVGAMDEIDLSWDLITFFL